MCTQKTTYTGQAQPAHPGGPGPDRPMPGRFIEGHLAFLKTELHITDAQLPQWEAVAKVLREHASARADLFSKMQADRNQPLHAPDLLERRLSMAELGVKQTQDLLAAVKPLYESMSDEQKATADLLLAHGPMGPHRHLMMMRRG